jgi:hypothetical protein
MYGLSDYRSYMYNMLVVGQIIFSLVSQTSQVTSK